MQVLKARLWAPITFIVSRTIRVDLLPSLPLVFILQMRAIAVILYLAHKAISAPMCKATEV